MNVLSALLLGILQGLTEFFPVSSSGHLVLAQSVIPGFSQPGVLFDTVLHAGTLLAIVTYFYRDIVKISIKFLFLIVLGSIPAAIVGYFFSDQIELLFGSVTLVSLALLFTALLNLFTDRQKTSKKKVTPRTAFLVGAAQALAIVPGISRSGSTIFAAVVRGVDREKAARFSFLLSVPAVLGANILQFTRHGVGNDLEAGVLVTGFLAAFLSGWFAIKTVLRILTRGGFRGFAIYAAVLGLVSILVL